MSRYCLDTSAYSHFKRGDPQVAELIDGAEWLGMPLIVVGELETGFLFGSPGHLEQNRAELAEFLAHPVVEELGLDSQTSRLYAEIVTALHKARTPLPTNDIWIAAVAARVGATVLSYDPHFEAIHRVGSLILPTPSSS